MKTATQRKTFFQFLKTKFGRFALCIWVFFSFNTTVFSQNWLWAKSASGTGTDASHAICTDAFGNIFITGYFNSPTITFGSFNLSNNGLTDIYVVKYDSSGTVLWAKSIGGNNEDEGHFVCTDVSGNVYITGSFRSPTITFGSFTLTNTGGTCFNGCSDMFIVKYDASGAVLWAKSEGGSGYDVGNSVSADAFGNVYVTGFFISPFITIGSFTLTNAGIANVYIVKYDGSGNVLWAKSAGGMNSDNAYSIASDVFGNVYLTGGFESPTITFGSFTLTNQGLHNMYLVKYNASGNVLWAKSAGGTSNDAGLSVSTSPSGNIYVTGGFGSTNITFGNFTLANGGGGGSGDIYVVKYDTSGTVLWARSAGGSGSDGGRSVSTDAFGNIYITGFFSSPSITFDSITLTPPPSNCSQGCHPSFIVKYDSNGNVLCADVIANGGDDWNGVSADPFGNAYVSGDFMSNPFIIGSNTLTLTSIGSENIFVAKYFCDSITPIVQPINSNSSMTVPNVFTPNNDGLNDVFHITSKNIAMLNCKIYNRWGVFVNELTKPNEIWDGLTTSGLQCTTGVYFYVITATGKDGKKYNEKGFMQLIEK